MATISNSSHLLDPSGSNNTRRQSQEHVYETLKELWNVGMTPIDLLTNVLGQKCHDDLNYQHRTCVFGKDGRLGALLDLVKNDYEGRQRLKEWLQGGGLELIGEVVGEELESVKQSPPVILKRDRLQSLSSPRGHKVPLFTQALKDITDPTSNRLFSIPPEQIPREIWANIFANWLPCERYMQPSSWSAPMLLCQVNRTWRSIALSLSELWYSISVVVRDNSNIRKKVEGLGTWLGRSGTRPLAISLRLCGDEMNREHSEVELDSILDLFISSIGRWEDVRLELLGPFSGSITNIDRMRAPLLKRFEVDFNYRSRKVMEPLFSMLSASPLLTDLVWHDNGVYEYQFPRAEVILPWSHFTHFKTDTPLRVKECSKVIRLCPRLIDCAFEMVILDPLLPQNFIPSTPAIHHHLRKLLIGSQHDQMYEFFNHLTLPALGALTLEWEENNGDTIWPHDSFKVFLSRSRCSFETFKVHTAIIDSGRLVELLGLLPTLTELSIEGDEYDALQDTLFRSLTHNETVGELCLCPKLQVITLAGIIASSEGTMAKMLMSRHHSDSSSQIACLQKVTVIFREVGTRNKYRRELEIIQYMGIPVVVELPDCRFGYTSDGRIL